MDNFHSKNVGKPQVVWSIVPRHTVMDGAFNPSVVSFKRRSTDKAFLPLLFLGMTLRFALL